MGRFRIFETDQFLKDLDRDFGGQQERIKTKLLADVYPQLKHQPYWGKNIKKLKNYTPQTWRHRIGDYRFFYAIDDRKRIVFMITIDHRGAAY
ncbi:MAG: type II toxin-antitoxin system RelE/ParE family toxin [Candidatus Omnitrophica bacterium]|nr:type II toxin-antitoxin system RelE/ParE family toxin [Candidatus Omnitrophota bacterium]